jgi:hypothetical protein
MADHLCVVSAMADHLCVASVLVDHPCAARALADRQCAAQDYHQAESLVECLADCPAWARRDLGPRGGAGLQ